MKIKYSLTVCFILIFHFINAQEDNSIYGTVVLQNSKTNTGNLEYVSNVSISSNDGYFKSQLTDSNGNFKIIVADRLIGEKIELYVEKEGYEVINKETLLNLVVGTKYPIRIIVSNKDDLEDSYFRYYSFLKKYSISRNEHSRIVDYKSKIIDSLVDVLNVQSDDYRIKISDLNQSHDLTIQQLAKQFASVNIDDLTNTYRDLHYLIFLGKIDEALALLNDIQFEERLRKHKSFIDKGEVSRLERKEDLQQLLIRARLKILVNDLVSGIKDLNLGLLYDENNVDFQLELALVYQLLNNPVCLKLYSDILKLTDDEFIRSCIYNNMGIFLLDSQEFAKANTKLLKAKKLRKRLYESNVARGNYIGTIHNLGNLYHATGDIKKSIKFFKIALDKAEDLYFENDSLYAEYYLGLLVDYSKVLEKEGDVKGANNFLETAFKMVDSAKSEISTRHKSLFYLNYGRFCHIQLEDSKRAFDFYNLGIKVIEKNLPEISEFYKSENLKIDYQYNIPVELAILYRNLTAVLKNDEEFKNESYVRSLKIYFGLINGLDKNGIIHLDQIVNIQIEYAMYQLLLKNEESKFFAHKVISSAKKNFGQLSDFDKDKYLDIGRIYSKLGLYYFLEESKDSSMYYAKKGFNHRFKEYKNKNKNSIKSLLHSVNELAINYLYYGKKDIEFENEILNKLKFVRRRIKRLSKLDGDGELLLNQTESFIAYFKKGVMFGEPNEMKILIKL